MINYIAALMPIWHALLFTITEFSKVIDIDHPTNKNQYPNDNAN